MDLQSYITVTRALTVAHLHSVITYKYQAWVVSLTRDKHSSLLLQSVSDKEKKFKTLISVQLPRLSGCGRAILSRTTLSAP